MNNQEQVWDEIAREWKSCRSQMPDEVYKFLKDKGGNILDLGCGSGRNLIKKFKTKFFCLDFSKEMLKHAEEKAKKELIDAEFIQSKSSKIPFEDNFFDSILFYATLHCIPTEKEREKTLEEIYRTLKVGSKALISTWGRNSQRIKNKPKETIVTWAISDDKKVERYTYIYDLDELEKQLKKIGFKIINSWEDENVNFIVEK